MSDESALEVLYANRDAKCKNAECGHSVETHVQFKQIKDDRLPLMYCSDCRAQGKECKLFKF